MLNSTLFFVVMIKVFLDGLGGFIVFVGKLPQSLFTKDIIVKKISLPFIRLIFSERGSAALFTKKALFTVRSSTVFC